MTAPQTPLRPGGATPAGGGTPRRGARPETLARGRATCSARAAGRYEDYVWLRTEQRRTIREAADRLGITFRHAQRYERERLSSQQTAVAS